ncbi:MAG: UbiH/UbiF/VisC/COQ6 family ubiquinone biosynthesis hydroxylase [Rhodovarius sp.]|nr:UbiH/UbiF/VisC/COQ6 family ubiquinone biosynthesis hydroxylase [Rhodovarius sp.]MCX7931273.1 UbiH/UbiF/VisC/COQ6 family ubiquinone biosynthesis hydroxylase [Rhodovarius sp.]MDW8315169.1 UbiH/UbiF/VisC/COQ6 family ubiquinone biosynthesis hydroxylase [Rhodovarius sp.]
MSSALEVTVAIVGAGPVGATLAAALAAEGIRAAVIDAQPLPPMELPAFDGRCYAIAAGSRPVLERAGVWQRLPEPPCPIETIRVQDGEPGEAPSPLSLTFRARESGCEAFGWMVEARSLRVALNARLPGLPALSVFAPAALRLATRSEEGVLIELTTGQRIAARLLVAAEGRGSPLRRAAGIPTTGLDYRQWGLVGAFAHERPHRNTALEQFLPNGPFAQLPLAHAPEGAPFPHASSFVWSDRSEIAQRMLALDEEAFSRELARRLGGALGAVRAIGRRWSYPLSALHAHRYVDVRLALVGDAAHGIHPIAGQGLNLGLRDAETLARLVAEALAAGEDPGGPRLLARYQAERRPAALLMLGATHVLERLFGNRIPPLRLARRVGIAAVDRIAPLKRGFARVAMGL